MQNDDYGQTQPLPDYLHEKVTHDSKDLGLAKIISNDLYPVRYTNQSDTGSLDVKLRRISSKFEVYSENQNPDLHNLDLVSLSSLYFRHSENAYLNIPLDVGLGTLSPITVKVTAGNVTKTYQYDYVDFSVDNTVIVNLAQNNTLNVSRNTGSVTVAVPPNFGKITQLYLDDNIINVACNTRCTINTVDNKEIKITVENYWGGRAHGMAAEITEDTRYGTTSNVTVLALFVLFLPLLYWIYQHVKNRK